MSSYPDFVREQSDKQQYSSASIERDDASWFGWFVRDGLGIAFAYRFTRRGAVRAAQRFLALHARPANLQRETFTR